MTKTVEREPVWLAVPLLRYAVCFLGMLLAAVGGLVAWFGADMGLVPVLAEWVILACCGYLLRACLMTAITPRQRKADDSGSILHERLEDAREGR